MREYNSNLVSTVIQLDIEHLLTKIEWIVKQFIVIEDIELCLFVPNMRYPIERASLGDFNFKNILKNPTLALYSAGIVKDTIIYSILTGSKFKKHFFKNVLSTDSYDKFSIADIELYSIEDVIKYHIADPSQYQKEKEKKDLEINLKRHFETVGGYMWHKNVLLHEGYLKLLEGNVNSVNNKYDNSLLGLLEEELMILSNYISSLELPCNNIFTVDDESRVYNIVYGEHILERRMKEINKL